jgi:maleylacetate reductase
MPNSGRVVLSRMDEVVYGKPAAESVAELARRYQAERVFLMVSGTLNRETDEIEKIRQRLGARCVATFDAMPPHTPREAVIAAAEQARAANADLIVTVGGGSITDGAKAVQLCLANNVSTVEGIDKIRAHKGVAPDMTAPSVRQISVPTTIAGGEFSAIAGVTNQQTKVKEMLRHDLVMIWRAALVPLPEAFQARLGPWLTRVGAASADYLRACARALLARRGPPPMDSITAALDGYAIEMAALRREGLTRDLPTHSVEQVFALGFALDQLGQHFADLARCVAEFSAPGRNNDRRHPPTEPGGSSAGSALGRDTLHDQQ